ncbi:MAG: hypothetical protein OEZ14_05675 [Acidimicrobiia bacterium]|nr:hypothetical protein [Acidimicrobiia bacterium]MDH5520006.1 hypothetical protein [Acidimicrobiia bacterium]
MSSRSSAAEHAATSTPPTSGVNISKTPTASVTGIEPVSTIIPTKPLAQQSKEQANTMRLWGLVQGGEEGPANRFDDRNIEQSFCQTIIRLLSLRNGDTVTEQPNVNRMSLSPGTVR